MQPAAVDASRACLGTIHCSPSRPGSSFVGVDYATAEGQSGLVVDPQPRSLVAGT